MNLSERRNMRNKIKLKIATEENLAELRKLSTVSLLIWIIGKSSELKKTLSQEEIVLECWLINPEKHSMRGYPQFPDSSVIIKRLADMNGKKGLLNGTTSTGYTLTEISKERYNEIEAAIKNKTIVNKKTKKTSNRSVSSIDEAPYKRLIRTSAYQKYIEGRSDQIVESDFLYFYGVNWQMNKSVIEGKFKNIDHVVNYFSRTDPKLKEIHELLNEKFKKTKTGMIS